jgi:hypothetical protein
MNGDRITMQPFGLPDIRTVESALADPYEVTPLSAVRLPASIPRPARDLADAGNASR